MSSPKILLLVSGSIAAFKSIALCSKLVQTGFEVNVALSESALHFVGAASFEGLTRKKVILKNFEEGSMMAHIDLERNADLILNYPSTATTLSHFAQGSGESLLGTLFLAHEFKKPFWIAPAMNQAMLSHPAVKENLKKIESWGINLFFGESGNLACGEVGAGRLLEPETMLSLIQSYFKASHDMTQPVGIQALSRKRILVTAGGTREPIDPVRSIINFSTGETGYLIAKHLESLGHDVTLLQSKASRFQEKTSAGHSGVKNIISYDTTSDFAIIFEQELKTKNFDFLVHTAAIADYAVDKITNLENAPLSQASKIQDTGPIKLTLKPNPKFLQKVRGFSLNPGIKLISFKLTSGESSLKLDSYDSEYIFHNELSKVSNHEHFGTFYARNAGRKYQAIQTVSSKAELVKFIADQIIANQIIPEAKT